MIQKLSSTIADVFESIAFLMIGISVFGLSYPYDKIGLIGYTMNFLFLLISRFINIVSVSFLINYFRIKKVNKNF